MFCSVFWFSFKLYIILCLLLERWSRKLMITTTENCVCEINWVTLSAEWSDVCYNVCFTLWCYFTSIFGFLQINLIWIEELLHFPYKNRWNVWLHASHDCNKMKELKDLLAKYTQISDQENLKNVICIQTLELNMEVSSDWLNRHNPL